jgi:hypothetical protein
MMFDLNKRLENLKLRYANADPVGRDLLRDIILNLAAMSGQLDSVRKWMEDVDLQRVRAQEEEKSPPAEEVKPEPAPEKEPEVEPAVVPVEEKSPVEPVEEKREVEPEKEVSTDTKLLEIRDALKDVVKRLSDLWEKVEDIEDAVAQHKRLIERMMGSPEEFLKKKKELEEKDVITPQEFGLRFYSDEKNGSGNYKFRIRRKAMAENKEEKKEEIKEEEKKEEVKEGSLDPTARRKRRLALLRSAQGDEKPRTLSDFYKVKEDIEKMKKLPQIPETPYVTEEQLRSRFEREKEKYPLWLKKLAADYDADRNVWYILHDGKPLYEVSYSKSLAPTVDDFASRTFGKLLLKDFIQLGDEEFIRKYGANPCPGEGEKEEKKEEPKEEKKEGFELRFMQGLGLVKQMLDKNLIDNPLKAALFEEMTRRGVQDPVSIIETAFRQAAGRFFDTVVALARKYADLDSKTFAEIEAFVKEARVQEIHGEEDMSFTEKVAAQELRRRAAEGSIPLLSDSVPYDPLREAIPKPQNWQAVRKK